MKLKKIFKDLPQVQIKGSKEIEVTGICANSKLVAPGNLFIAKRGKNHDGYQFISQAIAAGAVAILTDIFNPTLKNIVQVIYKDPAAIEAQIAAACYGYPSEELLMCGITGTSGKTTTSFLVKHLLDKAQLPAGLVGTIEYIIGPQRYQSAYTTPDASTNQKLLRDMVRHGCQSAVMEVSSHALEQGRVDQISFDLCLFTNLSQDHLDYHPSMEAYFAAKCKLFHHLQEPTKRKKKGPLAAIINIDSPWGQRLFASCDPNLRLSYAIDQPAHIQGEIVSISPKGTLLNVCWRGEKFQVASPLVGKFNAYNLLATFAVGAKLELPGSLIAQALSSAPLVPGRLESVANPLGIFIYVDYAHKPEALEKTLQTLREISTGRVITVFGCGGERDQSKRPLMGKIAQALSDEVIITSDNPRSEEAEQIAQQIAAGFTDLSHCRQISDRRQAIEAAIASAAAGDTVLIAGKGHELYQVFQHKTVAFSDVAVAKEAVEKVALAKVL